MDLEEHCIMGDPLLGTHIQLHLHVCLDRVIKLVYGEYMMQSGYVYD